MRIAAGKFRQVDFLNKGRRTLLGFAASELVARCQRENDVVSHRLPRQKLIKLLKYENTIGAGRIDVLAIQKDLAFDRFEVAADRFQDAGFPASGGAEND